MSKNLELIKQQDYWLGRFNAMACPCEILISTTDRNIAELALSIASTEAWRIEQKFSRYRDDNIIFKINHARGKKIEVDEETSNMLDFADQCYQLSEHKFDITSGVLRKIWTFDGSDHIPEQSLIDQIMQQVGWGKVHWDRPFITLLADMEIDFGGIGKEYAVDQSAQLIHQATHEPVLVNYGGDIFATAPRTPDAPWVIGVDDPQATGERAIGQIQLYQGGLATSGDARRFLMKDGIRYSHILNPETGWPVANAPRSVSVIANSCLEAGMLATFASLHGDQANDFLAQQKVRYWCS
ncbi:MAG: FAD:protein FMN transferase [Gammaproteobacteria bacterium]|nr:FAD:protein FMN transferase [Gammaproteobacteria bacterium]